MQFQEIFIPTPYGRSLEVLTKGDGEALERGGWRGWRSFKPKKTSTAGKWMFSDTHKEKTVGPIPEEIIQPRSQGPLLLGEDPGNEVGDYH